MKKSFFQRLRAVKAADLFHIAVFFFAVIPAMLYKRTHRPFWLVCEYENEARDNGYYFYRYMTQVHPEQRVVYAIRTDSPDYDKVKALGETVSYGSLRHWILYLAAEVNISSQKGGKPNAAVCYLLEVYGILKNRRVFLQHGIIKDNLPYVHYENAKFSLFTVSVEREYQYVSTVFGYPPGIVQKLGLCRFDDLQDCSQGGMILVMPTWREWISSGNRRIEDVDAFRHTEYYRRWTAFLCSEQLGRLLQQYDMTLVFYPHRNMQRFMKDFRQIKSERVKIAAWPEYDVHQLLKEAALLITDYSSVAMDFAYMDKPVLYYQFDYETFRAHQMEEGYFSYERDGFGPILRDEAALLAATEQTVMRAFAVETEYQRRINAFFDMRDTHNCQRTYEAIRKMAGK